MKQNIIAAAILAVGLIVASFLLAGRYSLLRWDDRQVVRLDHWTGEIKIYVPTEYCSSGKCLSGYDTLTPGERTPEERRSLAVDETLTTTDINASSNSD